MPIVYQKEIAPNTVLGLWKIDESVETLRAYLELTAEQAAFLNALREGKRQLHWLSARVLLQALLGTNQAIEFGINEYGKPFLVNLPHHISMSHSFDYAAAIISVNKRVGIDIERIQPKIISVKHKFLTEDESIGIDPSFTIEHLYACWCAKESIYKIHGAGNLSFLENIKLKPFNYTDKGIIEAHLWANGASTYYPIYFEKFNGYMLSYGHD